IHFTRWAAGDAMLTNADIVDVVSMNAGITLANWFKHEARRVYAMLDESDAERNLRRLEDWAGRKGGRVTPREAQQGCRWLKQPAAAEAALEEVVKRGRGTWEPSPAGKRGQPTCQFVLSTVSTVYANGTLPEKKPNSVDVDGVDASEAETMEAN